MTRQSPALSELGQGEFISWVREIDSLRFDFHLFANDSIAKLGLRQQDVADHMSLSASIFNAKLSGSSGWSLDQIVSFLEYEDVWDDFAKWYGERRRLYGGVPIPRDRR